MIDRFRLPLTFDAAALMADLDALSAEGWIPHFNRGFYDGDWSGLVLRGPAQGADSLVATAEAFADTPLLDLCPGVRAVLATLDCPLRSVRLLRLGPGGVIREHRDYDLGYDRREARLHVPVVTNPDVSFHLRNRRVVMAPGETWYLDLSQPHRVVNGGATDRIHLVIDVGVNDWLRDRIPFEADDPFGRRSRRSGPRRRWPIWTDSGRWSRPNPPCTATCATPPTATCSSRRPCGWVSSMACTSPPRPYARPWRPNADAGTTNG